MLLGRRRQTPWVKVCGITSWDDAALAVEAGAAALGFNFYAYSPRYIPPERAARITERLPRNVLTVGVFVNELTETINSIMQAANLAAVQLHGKEPALQVEALARFWPVIKAFRLRPDFSFARLRPYRAAAAFLVDAYRPGAWGGTGQPANWRLARQFHRYGRVILAGGLGPDNVVEALRRVRPMAIDVCSGVEAEPGRKDPEKLKAFFQQLRRYQRSQR